MSRPSPSLTSIPELLSLSATKPTATDGPSDVRVPPTGVVMDEKKEAEEDEDEEEEDDDDEDELEGAAPLGTAVVVASVMVGGTTTTGGTSTAVDAGGLSVEGGAASSGRSLSPVTNRLEDEVLGSSSSAAVVLVGGASQRKSAVSRAGSSVSQIVKQSDKLKERQALGQKNPSSVAQWLIDKEEAQENVGKDVDVDSLVDKIIEECEFFEHGELSFLEFKTWLERHDGILQMFTGCMHEEVWGLRGNALFRDSTAQARQPSKVAENWEKHLNDLTPRSLLSTSRCDTLTAQAACSVDESGLPRRSPSAVPPSPHTPALLSRCPRCNRPNPTLKLVDGRMLLECAGCRGEHCDGDTQQQQQQRRWEMQKCSKGGAAVKSEPKCYGVLYKIGKMLHQKRARYFVLVDNLLYYYNKQDDCKPKGFYFLEGCFVDEMSDEQSGKYGFYIAHHGEKYSKKEFFADSAAERSKWMTSLRESTRQQNLEQNYRICEQLGQGKFSVVYRAVRLKDGTEFAVKVIDKGKITGHERELLRSEMAILRLLQHTNLIKLEEMVDTIETLYIIMELVRGGELYDLLHQRRRLPELFVNSIIRQLLTTVAYLHKTNIVHRDLKPENILLTDRTTDAEIRLTDFGLSTLCGPNDVLKQPCGTLAYVAPEVLTLEGYGHKADAWSIGVIMYLLLRGRLPFPISRSGPTPRIRQGKKVQFEGPIWNEISSSARDLIKMLLEGTPADRISVEDAQKHIWIQNPTAVISEASPDYDLDVADDYPGAPLAFPEEVSASTFVLSSIPLKAVHKAAPPSHSPAIGGVSRTAVTSTITPNGTSVMVAPPPPGSAGATVRNVKL
eukprot:GHVS01098259.1.p1 GENE.GHVS01098259.1~~GHVS01098259.1.p1  ORF type:complete len:866 (+),score=169.49 GHVS01098259.1:78-2600(+)